VLGEVGTGTVLAEERPHVEITFDLVVMRVISMPCAAALAT